MSPEFSNPNKSPIELLRKEFEQLVEIEGPDGFVAMELKLLNDLEERVPKVLSVLGDEGFKHMRYTAIRGISDSTMDQDAINRRVMSVNRIFDALAEQYEIK